MSLQIAPLEARDVSAYTRLELAAFRSHPRTPMVWTKGENASVHAYNEAGKHKSLQNHRERSIKCFDTNSGKMVAGATFTFAFQSSDNGETMALVPADLIPDDAAPPTDWPDGGNWAIARFFRINTPKLVQQHLGGEPYIMLDNLTVHPDYQGRGVGQRLLSWGAVQADRLSIRMCLESTPAGRRLYESFGFREVVCVKADMHALGWSEPYDEEAAVRIFMIREVGSKTPRVDWSTPF